ncbi:MAG: arylsulfatase [Ilumatobacteraceae bacterium]
MIGPVIGRTLADSVPHWPTPARPPEGSPNVLVILLDDVGFSDFGCYGSEVETPVIDGLAADGVRMTGFHTTAMCSTTRASLLTGHNHHRVGMGCLANFDSGFPGYRGKLDPSIPTIAEVLRPHGYRNYMVGKWHVVRLTETGPSGPFDGWPLSRGFDRYYGFLDAETDQYTPELVRDNSHVTAPGTWETGYHLTEDLADRAIEFLSGHQVGSPDTPWFMLFAPGACHAPHQAPRELIDKYDGVFAKGWDQTRIDRLARQLAAGIVPEGTQLPPRNDWVQPWDEHSDDERKVFTRLAAAYAAMLEHTDINLGRIVDFLERSGMRDDTIIMVLSDNGASQEGGPNGFINAMGPYNGITESLEDKLANLDSIGGPDSHSNFPWGWSMASNTPLRRYKQNTHGGGVRDPLVISWPGHLGPAGSLRHQFCHASDLAPTICEIIGIEPTQAFGGTSFASALTDPSAHTGKSTQYFEMFGHRGIWSNGMKAVAFHAPGTPFEDDRWELYDLAADFNEVHDLAEQRPDDLARLIEMWWDEAARNHVLPLDDRFAERFAENANRHLGDRRMFTFWRGVGHVPTDVAPDLRSRSYRITAHVDYAASDQGVLVSHGDPTTGYSLFVRDGHLVHDLNIGGSHQIVTSNRPIPVGARTLGFEMVRHHEGFGNRRRGVGTLLIDGEPAGAMTTENIFWLLVSWSGLDIGFDRGSTVTNYRGRGFVDRFEYTGMLERVVFDLTDDQDLDHGAAGEIELSRD